MNADYARELTAQKVEENVRNAIKNTCLKGLFSMGYESQYLTKDTVANLRADGYYVDFGDIWSTISWK